jgi:hypothetical protein
MKTNKILSFILTLVVAVTITSCVQDDDYSVPNSLGEEENAGLQALLAGDAVEVSIGELKAMYQDETPEQIVTNIYVKGYISSSDQTGNFFKEIYLQDAPENPTTAIKLVMNQVESYNQYNVGREVYIKLNGLYVGEERVGNQVITIGGGTETDQFGTTVTQLSENQRTASMFRSENTFPMIPKSLTFSGVSTNDIGVYAIFEGVEFADDLNGLRYFDPIQDFDTARTMQACTGFDYSTFTLETSSFATFKDELLPTGNGTVAGVITKTFDGSSLILALNTTADVNMNDGRCNLLNPEDFSPLFEETFESYANNAFVNANGWTNYAEAGTFRWRIKTTTDTGNSGSKVAWMGAFNSGVPSNIAWLISPAINLDAQDFEFVNFITSNDFDDDSELELLISTDWDGTEATITTSTWTTLPGNIVSDSEFYQNWVDSGLIDLSSYTGTAYVAFRYIGGDNAANTIDGNFELDNFQVLIQN